MRTNHLALGLLLLGVPMLLGCTSISDERAEASGGNGGASGAGGDADAGNVEPSCADSSASCTNGRVDPIVEDDNCMLARPPVLLEACEGTESLERPLSCTPTGSTVTYQLTFLEIVDDCNLGYDLDGCDGDSCLLSALAPGEGLDGVDNGLGGLASRAILAGTNLGVVNQAFYDNFCDGDTDIKFVADANPEENCLTVQTLIGDQPEGTVFLNLSDSGCVSGRLSNLPFVFREASLSIDNAVVRLTMSDRGLANGIVGGTIDQTTATALASRWIPGVGSALVVQLFDINDDLAIDPRVACNALSVALRIGGVTIPPAASP